MTERSVRNDRKILTKKTKNNILKFKIIKRILFKQSQPAYMAIL